MNKITLKKRLKKLLFFFNYIFSLRIRKLYKIEKLINNFDVNITAVDVGASYFPHVKWGIIKRSKSTLWIAIDPNKQNLEYARLWDYKSKIKIVEKAVGIKNEKSILYVTNIDSGSSLLKIQIPFNSKHRVTLNGIFPVKETSIYTSKIDKIFNELGVNDNSLIMKLDTQGTEFQIVKSLIKSKFRKTLLAVELENNILHEPIYMGSSETHEILKFFKENNFEVISLDVVTSIYPKSSRYLKQKNIPSECDWVFMKKFEILCSSISLPKLML